MSASADRDAVALLHGLGDLYLRHGQQMRARVLLLLAVQVDPDSVPLLGTLARAFLADGDGEHALAAISRIESLGESGFGLELLRARALWRLGRPVQARAAFRRHLAQRAQENAR